MPDALVALSQTLDLRTALDASSTQRARPSTIALMPEHSPRHLRLVVSSPLVPRPSKDALERKTVERAQQLMREGLATPWTVTSLARQVAVSRPVLARRFQARTGTSPMRWLTDLRMERAAERLQQCLSGREEKLSVIAAEVGYRSEFAFNRAFKRHHGVSPGRYRQGTQTTFRAAA